MVARRIAMKIIIEERDHAKNLPVTNIEYPIGDDVLIVSKTDTKGRIVYFNDQFVKASGFSEAELINQPHKIVRHRTCRLRHTRISGTH